MSHSREQLVRFLSGIDLEGKAVLDAGCGTKPGLRFTSGSPKSYATLDVDESVNPDFCVDLNTASRLQGEVDTVLFLEVAEHLWNPIHAIGLLWGVLNVGGQLVFSAPFVNPLHDKHDFARYTDEWWREILLRTGFRDVTIQRRTDTTGLLAQFYKRVGMRISKIRLPKQRDRIHDVGYMGTAIKGESQ